MIHHKNMIRLTITLFLIINIIEMISCYAIPAINIRIRRPSGIEASIPNVQGIEKFTFIVTINRQLTNTNDGDMTRYMGDVLVPTNGEWVFRDSSVQLKVGDVLYYQVHVQYKKKIYTKRDQRFRILESHFVRDENFAKNPSSSASRQQQTPTEIPEQSPLQQESCEPKLETIKTQLNIILSKLKSIHDESSPLQDRADSIVEVLNHLLQDSKIGTKLLLRGDVPPGNVLESVRELVTDKLKLHDMYSNVISAKKTEDGILFEVKSPLNKKRILYRANQYLQNSKLKIYDNNVMVPDNIMEQDNDDMYEHNIDTRFARF